MKGVNKLELSYETLVEVFNEWWRQNTLGRAAIGGQVTRWQVDERRDGRGLGLVLTIEEAEER